MDVSLRSRRLHLAVIVAGLAGLVAAAGCSAADLSPTPAPIPRIDTGSSVGATRIELRLGADVATATLADTAPARAFAATLPLKLALRGPMGQAKSGPLPHPLPGPFGGEGSEPVVDPQVGQLYDSPPSSTFAIYHDDLGQTVPPPGLVRLGTVDTGLAAISDAGNHLDLQIQAPAPSGS